MAKLKDKIENALNETRILVLGIQILIGFSFRTFFEPGFEKMTPYTQQLQLAGLGLMLVGLGVLLVPAPYHRIVLHGRNTAKLHRLATATVSAGLLPFAVSMGFTFFLGAHWIFGTLAAAVYAGIVTGIALLCWYGLEIVARTRRLGRMDLHAMIDPLREIDMKAEEETNLTTRLKQVLIECRVVLPGAQALLGFQLIIMWMTKFTEIPMAWKLMHLASLTSVAVCTILLILPAAYHRIVDQGEDSEKLHHVTSKVLLMAMVFLALGISGDFYVVSRITGIGAGTSTAMALLLLLLFGGLWFGYTFWQKHRLHGAGLSASHLATQKTA